MLLRLAMLLTPSPLRVAPLLTLFPTTMHISCTSTG
jgi:hypothetical protein